MNFYHYRIFHTCSGVDNLAIVTEGRRNSVSADDMRRDVGAVVAVVGPTCCIRVKEYHVIVM